VASKPEPFNAVVGLLLGGVGTESLCAATILERGIYSASTYDFVESWLERIGQKRNKFRAPFAVRKRIPFWHAERGELCPVFGHFHRFGEPQHIRLGA